MSRVVLIGREQFSRTHLKVFRDVEIRSMFGELAEEVLAITRETTVLYLPLSVSVEFCGRSVYLPAGVSLASGVYLDVPGGLYVPELLDEEFLEFLLFDLPRSLDEARRPVVVEDIDQRFTRDVREGVLYALDILSRISVTYRVPVLVYGDRSLEGAWSFARRLACGDKGLCSLDGEPFCGGP
ncbi:hypothetical protein IG193_02630 [Infirmifilum lucidum]|uniref:Uncharacterized protein n=1 Tax=Infirmifilum lucidum TaxID=2776706 RepID=A0A7L9FKI2_9CREN|nr:hypothetical protein [Infirmifilum lucidum]QOJ79376.1 hypothetical protein IG193_02630 [Infirmifilum lucidum]